MPPCRAAKLGEEVSKLDRRNAHTVVRGIEKKNDFEVQKGRPPKAGNRRVEYGPTVRNRVGIEPQQQFGKGLFLSSRARIVIDERANLLRDADIAHEKPRMTRGCRPKDPTKKVAEKRWDGGDGSCLGFLSHDQSY